MFGASISLCCMRVASKDQRVGVRLWLAVHLLTVDHNSAARQGAESALCASRSFFDELINTLWVHVKYKV